MATKKKPALQTQYKRKRAVDKLTEEAERLGMYPAPDHQELARLRAEVERLRSALADVEKDKRVRGRIMVAMVNVRCPACNANVWIDVRPSHPGVNEPGEKECRCGRVVYWPALAAVLRRDLMPEKRKKASPQSGEPSKETNG